MAGKDPHSEGWHQRQVIKWTQQKDVREQWPELKLLHHIPNERKCTPQQGKLLKLSGVRSGVPDLHLPVPKGKYHGLYIEMKDLYSSTSAEQDWWIEELIGQGHFCEICHGYESAIRVLERYMSLGGGHI